MRNVKLTAIAATAAIAIAGAAPATGSAKAHGNGKHTVKAESTYVFKKAGKIFDGTLFKGETFKVKRLSKSGKYAYGMAYGHVNRHVWIDARVLQRKK